MLKRNEKNRLVGCFIVATPIRGFRLCMKSGSSKKTKAVVRLGNQKPLDCWPNLIAESLRSVVQLGCEGEDFLNHVGRGVEGMRMLGIRLRALEVFSTRG